MDDRDRLEQLHAWLRHVLGRRDYHMTAASSDASFRRYYRVRYGETRYIAMDAPPDKEDCRPYITVAGAFAGAGLNVPRVLQADVEQGFLLITDLGERTYLQALTETNGPRLYDDALDALCMLQTRGVGDDVFPDYSHALLMSEMALFRDWYLVRHLAIDVDEETGRTLDRTFAFLADAALAQPRVWVHRDYHSRNLMVTETANPGILDFQDAVIGPVTYDLVSLLRDCYIRWPQPQVDAWRSAYYGRIRRAGVLSGQVTLEQFRVWFDLMGVQRHLKAIGIFARLNHRDAKPGYLNDIPRVLTYIQEICRRYPSLGELDEVVRRRVIPRMESAS